MGTITSVDAVLTLTIPLIFPTPVQLHGFSMDDIYGIERIRSVETRMGVDGVLSGGFVHVAVVQSITLQADSESNDVFDAWWTNMQASRGTFPAQGLIKLPAIATKFKQTTGFLTGYTPAPPAKRVLEPRVYEITWQNIAPLPD